MKKPKAVLFDYGHTLVYETDFNLIAGGRVLYDNIISGDAGITKEEFAVRVKDLYNELGRARRELALELPAVTMLNFLRDYYGIRFGLSDLELEEQFWNELSPPVAMDGAKELLDFLHSSDIKTCVISNLWYQNEVLKRRIDRLIPNNRFSFVISTSEYGIRKPNRQLFEIALKRLGVEAKDAWFIGDEPLSDVFGSFSAGLTPVWINSDIVCPYKFTKQEEPKIDCLKISNLLELKAILEKL